jgi:hypothetical protein
MVPHVKPLRSRGGHEAGDADGRSRTAAFQSHDADPSGRNPWVMARCRARRRIREVELKQQHRAFARVPIAHR